MIKFVKLEDLIKTIMEYNSFLRKLTLNCGLDYISCSKKFRDSNKDTFTKIEELFPLIFFDINENYDNFIECGCVKELVSMEGVFKYNLRKINEIESKIEDLTWKPINELTVDELDEYLHKLTLEIIIK